MSPANVHVERARQIADALDAPDQERTLHEQFFAEWKAWEAEDPTRTMAAFDREIGRGRNYTNRVVRIVTGDTRAWGSGSNRRDEVAAKALRNAPELIAELADELHDDPKFQAAVASASSKISAREDRRRDEREQVQRGISADELAFERFKSESRAGNFGNADRLTDQFEIDDERAAWCRKYAERLRGLADWYDALADATPISDDELSRWLTNS